MKENKYDNEKFFAQYGTMSRSVEGLKGAGEWHALRSVMPSMVGKCLLDLGCGYGWHCKYAVEQGATQVVGIDLSSKMIAKAKEINSDSKIEYRTMAIEDFDYRGCEKFDVVLSSLTFHYIESFENVCADVTACLKQGGEFIFSVEHPIFTSYGSQEWCRNENGEILHWPVDRYFSEGKRESHFLGEEVIKYHKTLTTYVGDLIRAGFEITSLIEPEPDSELLETVVGMKDELRRPMMLIIAAKKK